MSVYTYPFQSAQQNFATNRLARWHTSSNEKVGNKILATARMAGEVFRPGVEFAQKISAGDSVFTIGSCFAREMERALGTIGFNVLSLRRSNLIDPNLTSGYANRYNTASILNELKWAAGEPFPANGFAEVRAGAFVDLHSHPVIGVKSSEEIKSLREALTTYFAQIYSADVVTVTLGLIEGWFDKKDSTYLNFAPIFGQDARRILTSDRFEFRVMSYEENMAALEEINALIERHNPKARIIVTVSPVSLSATFSDRDVVVANCFSKSMLRTCAETWKQRHPDRITYFPSYEMATLSNRATAYADDGMHIRPAFVNEIIGYFKEVALELAPAAE